MHRHAVKVYIEDTDAQGIVYHANYIKFLERGRSEALEEVGLPLQVAQEAGQLFVVHELHIKYRRPARLGDLLEVRTTWERSSAFRATFHQAVHRGDDHAPLVSAEVEVVCVDLTGKLVELPAALFS